MIYQKDRWVYLFINKRKKIINSVFGELEYRNLMYHGKTQITLWDKTFDIKVFPVTNSKSKENRRISKQNL